MSLNPRGVNEDEEDDRLVLTKKELHEMLESVAESAANKAADKAADKTLERLGLNDEDAEQDMHNLRAFFKAMRFARRKVLKAVIYNVIDKAVTLGVVYLMVKMGMSGSHFMEAFKP